MRSSPSVKTINAAFGIIEGQDCHRQLKAFSIVVRVLLFSSSPVRFCRECDTVGVDEVKTKIMIQFRRSLILECGDFEVAKVERSTLFFHAATFGGKTVVYLFKGP